MGHFRWRLFGAVLGLAMAVVACNQNDGHDSSANQGGQSVQAGDPRLHLFTVLGSVQYAEGDDHSGIQVYAPGTSLMAITDDEGSFRLEGLSPGSYRIKARADGYELAVVGEIELPPPGMSLEETPEEPVTLASLTLKPLAESRAPARGQLGSLQGVVTIEGVEDSATSTDLSRCVIALAGTPYRTTCASDGSFLLWNLPADQYTLSTQIDGFFSEEKAVRVLPGPPGEPVRVVISPLAPPKGNRVLSGVVELIGPDGLPVTDYAGISIQLAGRKDLDRAPLADGSFSFKDLMPAVYSITASGKGYVSPEPIDVDLTELPLTEVQLTLKPVGQTENSGATLQGVALKDVDGVNDMSGIQVALLGTSITAVTDEIGEFTMERVPPGVYRLIAQAQGFEDARMGPIELAVGDRRQLDTLLLEKIRDYPTVLSIDPVDNSRDVIVRREMTVTVRFSKKMKPESLRKAIKIEPAVSYRVYAGKERGDTDDDLARIILAGAGDEPTARFKTSYTITIDENAEDIEGLTLQEAFRASFTTGAAAVIATRPVDNERQVLVGPAEPVEVFFNAPMDPATLGVKCLRIRPEIKSGQPIVSSRTDPQTGWTRMLIQSDWQPGTRYEVTIQKQARTLRRDSLENAPYTFRFQTATMMELSPQETAR